MRQKHSALLAGLFGLALLATSPFAAVAPVAAATLAATTTCSNGVNNAGGQGLICEVTIENTITAIGGSATVTVRECHGAAGDPQAACTIEVSVLTEPVTSVDQCNGSINGGGGTLRCSVQVTNTYVAVNPNPVDATVNQCVGSGDGFTVGCDPSPPPRPARRSPSATARRTEARWCSSRAPRRAPSPTHSASRSTSATAPVTAGVAWSSVPRTSTP